MSLRLWIDLAKHRKRSCGRDGSWLLKSVGCFRMSNGRLYQPRRRAERKKKEKKKGSNPIKETVLQMGQNNKAMKHAWANNTERNTGASWQLEAQRAKKRFQRCEFITHERKREKCAHSNWCHLLSCDKEIELLNKLFKVFLDTPRESAFRLTLRRPPPPLLPPLLPPPPLAACQPASLPVSWHQARVITNTPLNRPPPKKKPRPGWYSLHLSPRSSRFPTAAGSATSGRVIKPDWALRTWLGSRYEARQQRDESGGGGRREPGQSLGWKIGKQKRAVSVSQRLPSPQHHLLSFADVKERGDDFADGVITAGRLPIRHLWLST